MTFRRAIKAVLPPVAIRALRHLRLAYMPESVGLAFAPRGWQTELKPESDAVREAFLAHERRQWLGVWEPFIRQLAGNGPASHFADACGHQPIDEHNGWMTFAYVLALCARRKSSLRILDYGSNLGYFCWAAQALLPGVALDYHCRDLPDIVREGRKFTPQATWHADDSCLDQQYDLLVFSSVLQYVKDWRQLVARAGKSADPYVFVAQTPVVERVPSFVSIQRQEGTAVLYQAINKSELKKAFSDAGLQPAREFLEGGHYPIDNAPEQPSYYACLLRRAEGTA